MGLLNKKQKQAFDAEYQKLLELSDKLKTEAEDDAYISTDSYEVYRDSYRFFSSLFIYSMIASFVLLLMGSIIVFTKDPSKTFATSRNGHVFPLDEQK